MPLWKPNDLSDLNLWLTSVDFNGSVGEAVPWYDRSGGESFIANPSDVSDSATPNIDPGALNDHSGVVFTEGRDEWLVSTSTTAMDVGVGDFYCATLVSSPSSSSGIQAILAHDKTGSSFELRHTGNGGKFVWAVGGTVLNDDSNVTNDTVHFLSCEKHGTDPSDSNNGTLDHYRNGGSTIETAADFNTNISDDEFRLGRRDVAPDSEASFNGSLYEVIVYHKEISATNQDAVEGFTMHKFAQEGTLPAAHPYRYGPPTACHCVSENNLSTNFLSSNITHSYELKENLNIRSERK